MSFLSRLAQLSADEINIPDASADAVITNALNTTYFIGGIVAVIVIIVAGIMYVTSAGDAGNINKAKNLLLFAIIGLVVVISAFAITLFVRNAF